MREIVGMEALDISQMSTSVHCCLSSMYSLWTRQQQSEMKNSRVKDQLGNWFWL